MGWIRKTPSGRWRAEYRNPAGKKRSLTFDRKADADRWLAEQTTTMSRGDYVDPARGRVPFAESARRWLDSAHDLRPSSRARASICINNDLIPALGHLKLTSISYETVQGLVDEWVARGRAPATVRKSFYVLRSVMDSAVTANRIARSPCTGITLPRIKRRAQRYLDAGEVHRLAEEVPERYRALILTAAYLGLRWSELVGLRHQALGFRKLTVCEALVEVGGRFESSDLKTETSVRTITLPAFLADVLGEHVSRFPSTDGLVFSAPEGGPLRRHFIRRVFRPAVRRARLDPLRFHDLRHTAASLAIAEGAHPKVIQDRLGHASITTTLNTYGHLFPNLDESLADALNEVAKAASAAYLPPERHLTVIPTRQQ